MQHVAIQKPCLQFLRTVIFPNGRDKLAERLSQIRLQQWQPWRHTNSQVHCRGAKSKATIQLKDLPQGVLEKNSSVRVREQDGPAYPMMIQQARNNMRKFADCVLLTRVGGFYELYFEHANIYGPLLNIKVAQKKTVVGLVPMAGFPFFQLDRFLKILVQDLSKFVAISEEFANSASDKVKSGGLMFDRKVTRIITPGTLIDEKFMDPYENNFLLAIHPGQGQSLAIPGQITPMELRISKLRSKSLGLAWLDLSTGDFFTQVIDMGSLSSALARIGARETILSDDVANPLQQEILHVLEQDRHLVTRHPIQPELLPISSWLPMLESAVPPADESLFTDVEITAGGLLLSYVREKLQGLGLKLQPPVRRQGNESMGIDKNSLKGLEVLETVKDGMGGGKGSLLHSVRRTITKGGTRLLKDWIASPSMSLQIINARLDLVSEFCHDQALREKITSFLGRTYDSQRLVQKFSMGRGEADDLISLLRTIEATNELASTLEKHISTLKPDAETVENSKVTALPLQTLSSRLSLDGPNALAHRITAAIDEDGLMQSHRFEENSSAEMVSLAQGILLDEGSVDDKEAMSRIMSTKTASKKSMEQESEEETWIMRKSASSTLESLHNTLDDLYQQKVHLTSNLRDQLGAQSLSLRWSPGIGHICHIRGVKDVRTSLKNPASTRDARATKSTRSFYHPEWNTLGGNIDRIKFQIRAEEQRVFQELRERVVSQLVKLRRNAAVLDELDIACSFAVLAQEQGFVRPVLDLTMDHKIVGGRHPTVKLGLEEQGRAFVSNDCFLGEKERIWFITGPNMAGKSTFLRQNALISILAQVGSFVPADHAEIGLVDRIFTRVGSADNLYRDESTFMVEMLETAAILNQATPRSFVIMDEIGRGTTPEDGIAVGYACLHHLYHKNQCRALFATHFHALVDMSKDFENLGCYCTDVAEGLDGSFSYIHRLRKGVNRQSHALKVARLAGVPESAIDTARQVLEGLRSKTQPLSEEAVR
ncbi:DNA mismatch repair ATPase msh1 [Lobaria immixta]|nr:DNA mismatch repair ATPase msh1 [Lobaria immixta]